MRTGERGHGVRAMRSFEPHQIIVEYCGEIITLDESDRRMNNEYKGKNVCLFCVELTLEKLMWAGLLSHDIQRQPDH